MNKEQGFSIIEIFIALLIISTASFGLIFEQFLIKKQLNNHSYQLQQLLQRDNNSEHDFIGL